MIRHRAVWGILMVMLLVSACAETPALTAASAPAAPGAAPSGGAGRDATAVSTAGGTLQPILPGGPRGGASGADANRPAPTEFAPVAELRDIYFDFDKYEIRPDAAKVLDATAGWLNANVGHVVLIEGHCDERGTDEYNVVLGESRAKAALNYLTIRGVAASRATVLSYGRERPLCTEHDERCWAKNRRAHFAVKRQ